MRLKSKSVLLALVAVFAMSAVVTAAASATTPEFKPVPTKKKFTVVQSGSADALWGVNVSTCTKGTATGEITGARTVGDVVLVYTGCTASGETKSGCPLSSEGAKAGEVVIKPLSGELGTAEPSGHVGLLLKPETKKVWTTFAGDECSFETEMSGSLAGLVQTTGKKQTTNKLEFNAPSGVQEIRSFKLDSGTLEAPKLTVDTMTYGIAATDELKFEEAVEVT
jgi:hypothetical protein